MKAAVVFGGAPFPRAAGGAESGADRPTVLPERTGVRGGKSGVVALALSLAGLSAPALAQNAASPNPTVTTGQPAASFGPQGAATIKKLIGDGYEIKTGFVDPNGGAYLALQKATSAYLCHSNPSPTCEKLN